MTEQDGRGRIPPDQIISDEEEDSDEMPIMDSDILEHYKLNDFNIVEMKILIQNHETLNKRISELNEEAILLMKHSKNKESLIILQQCEKILEFAASSGKKLDRNLIIVILYNIACNYQSLWHLEKCAKYIDGVIFNLQDSISEDENTSLNLKHLNSSLIQELKEVKLKKLKFLIQATLQYCAILSQLDQHVKALENAIKASGYIYEMFKDCLSGAKEMNKKGAQDTSFSKKPQSRPQTNNKINKTNDKISKKSLAAYQTDDSGDGFSNLSKSATLMKNEISFTRVLLEFAIPTLEDMISMGSYEQIALKGIDNYAELKKTLYFWKNNPENNEKHLRKELKVPFDSQISERESRSLLGIADGLDWIENFNIGSVMHMSPMTYEEFTFFAELSFEISKRHLMEKIVLMSICWFTIATEIRFKELEKTKNNKKKSSKKDKDDETGEGFKISEIYHLKAIECACKYIVSNCPYINHLVTSYHKHYNQNLEIIPEESFYSITNAHDYKYYIDEAKNENQRLIHEREFIRVEEEGVLKGSNFMTPSKKIEKGSSSNNFNNNNHNSYNGPGNREKYNILKSVKPSTPNTVHSKLKEPKSDSKKQKQKQTPNNIIKTDVFKVGKTDRLQTSESHRDLLNSDPKTDQMLGFRKSTPSIIQELKSLPFSRRDIFKDLETLNLLKQESEKKLTTLKQIYEKQLECQKRGNKKPQPKKKDYKSREKIGQNSDLDGGESITSNKELNFLEDSKKKGLSKAETLSANAIRKTNLNNASNALGTISPKSTDSESRKEYEKRTKNYNVSKEKFLSYLEDMTASQRGHTSDKDRLRDSDIEKTKGKNKYDVGELKMLMLRKSNKKFQDFLQNVNETRETINWDKFQNSQLTHSKGHNETNETKEFLLNMLNKKKGKRTVNEMNSTDGKSNKLFSDKLMKKTTMMKSGSQKVIPKLNLNTLKSEEIRYYSPRENLK